MQDNKRELLRHLVATIGFRGNVAIREAPEHFADFQPHDEIRTPVELLAHIGDLIEGSRYLLAGEMRIVNASPLPWREESLRFYSELRELDALLAGDEPIAVSIEKLVQGPIADALTHIGQIVLLRRAAGVPVRSEAYFQAHIEPGRLPEID